MDVGTLFILRTFACTNWRKMMVINWTNWHLRRESLGMSSLKEGAVGAVAE
jgi:hypothetical protein